MERNGLHYGRFMRTYIWQERKGEPIYVIKFVGGNVESVISKNESTLQFTSYEKAEAYKEELLKENFLSNRFDIIIDKEDLT